MKRAAVIGLGDISGIHLAAIERNPAITLCAVCDLDPDAQQRAPSNIPFYTDYKELARVEKPDCVHLCLPHFLHYPVAQYFAQAGIHVFCEKPLALNAQQAASFVQLETLYPDIHLGICLQNRMNESVETLLELIQSKKYGEILSIQGLVLWSRKPDYYSKKPWRGRWDTAGGGCMINQAIHTLDLLYYLGGPIHSLRAGVCQLLGYDIQVEDTAVARLEFENGASGLFVATVANDRNESVQIRVQMEQAEFILVGNTLYRQETDGSRIKYQEGAQLTGEKFYYGASHSRLIDRFYKALEEGTDDYIHIRDGEMSIRLIDAIQESGRTGQTVLL